MCIYLDKLVIVKIVAQSLSFIIIWIITLWHSRDFIGHHLHPLGPGHPSHLPCQVTNYYKLRKKVQSKID